MNQIKPIKLEINWQVEDGYAGKSRLQTTTIDIERDIMSKEDWNSLNNEERTQIIDEAVQQDFNQKISYSIDNMDSVIKDL